MSYIITLSFDLHDAEAKDYECLEKELENINLLRKLKGNSGEYSELPQNTFAGVVIGKDSGSLRTEYINLVKAAFEKCDVEGKFFLVVGNEWMWSVHERG